MQYLGGKFRTWKQITTYLESIREGRDFLEPFVGGAWITQGMKGRRVASDANVALITMYKALLGGWVPPEKVSEEEYQYYKKLQDVSDPMTAFVGFGCSFGGIWFSTYARSNTRNYALNAKNSLMRKVAMLQGVEFVACDYRTHTHTHTHTHTLLGSSTATHRTLGQRSTKLLGRSTPANSGQQCVSCLSVTL